MLSAAQMKSALWHRARRKARCFQVYLTGITLFSCCMLSVFAGDTVDEVETSQSRRSRSLLSANVSEVDDDGLYPEDVFTLKEKKQGAIVLHIIGMCYMFLALAIACDEFFVPALAVITEKLAISEDVAGATFMAAGGSAPELFTSFIGTFLDPKSNVGFGTIVGSAVFNVLFVIGMCAVFSKTVLKLTWWPLFRDCIFYGLALILLIVFFLDQRIEWWESLVLLSWYLCYVTFMKFNHIFEIRVKDLLRTNQVQTVDAEMQPGVTGAAVSKGDLCLEKAVEYFKKNKDTPCFRYGTLQLVIQTIDPLGEASIEVKAKQLKRISGFKVRVHAKRDPELQLGKSANGRVSSNGTLPTDRRISNSTTSSRHGSQAAVNPLSDAEFEPTDSQQVQRFNALIYQDKQQPAGDDGSSRGSERNKEGRDRLSQSSVILSSEVPAVAVKAADPGCLPGTYHDDCGRRLSAASKGSRKTVIPDTGGALEASLGDGEEPLDISWPKGWKARIIYLIKAPVIFLMYLTTPDCRKPNLKRLYPLTFIMSIMWIGGFSYLMVWMAKEIGKTADIPTRVMGLTFLAAGTSIPDLITSVLVARKGFGDMAVSSSIGSNLFDITVGLPLPWVLFSAVYGGVSVAVNSGGLFCSVMMLFFMLIFVVVIIGLSRWRMSRPLGFSMFLLYVVFLVVSLLLMYETIVCPIELSS